MDDSSKSRASGRRSWIPVVVVVDDATLRIFCTDNVQAVAAVKVASERGLTAKRFKARATDPAPIEIRVTDERPEEPTQVCPTFSMEEVGWGEAAARQRSRRAS